MNIYEDKEYVIECRKCKHIYKYTIDDMSSFSYTGKDSEGKNIQLDKIVQCPICGETYYFGYETKIVR